MKNERKLTVSVGVVVICNAVGRLGGSMPPEESNRAHEGEGAWKQEQH